METDIQQSYVFYRNTVNNVNPFTQLPVSALLENGTGSLDPLLLHTLLTFSFEDIYSKYPDIGKYMKTCQLVFYSNFQITKVLQRKGKQNRQLEREAFREEYVATYRTDWIEPILQNHSDYAKNTDCFNRFIQEVSGKLERLNGEIKQIIDYENMDSEFRHILLNRMGIDVCPYCNRQFITQFMDRDKFKTTADLDHFYPKAHFPLFALSMFNFVPSCQICNSRFKLDKGIEILYPYNSGFNQDTYFHIPLRPDTKIGSILGEDTDFELELIHEGTGPDSTAIHNSIELFNLSKVYQSHKDYVRELLYKKNAYSESYKGDLMSLLGKLNLSAKEMNLFQYGFTLTEDEFGKRPLSKLAYDIIQRNS
ncbi:hypothetical protein [Paenibacillus sp. MMS20-IR301]|uniref:hypothetical protein n=1 Tax=Paenibacillus sp. MMS20-IR301 TaxID=2895946 RepID=UPI0028EF4119|nr:hypothetical protein [Paenibacillus sp. MMS20-IR301]WNS45350.1 hypothetical protein LOS79_08785 [Paenibacillus sp. MMS20-IR301]